MVNKSETEYPDLWDFVKNPINDIPLTSSFNEKIKIFFPLLLLELILAIVLGLIINGLVHFDLISLVDHKLRLFTMKMPLWISFATIVIFAPFVEELFFRLPLRLREKYMHLNVLIIVAGIALTIIPAFKVNYIKISILTFGIIIWLIYYANKAKYNPLILSFWNRKFLYLFYFSAVSFGVIHIFNYKPEFNIFLFLPLLILPQLLVGLFCGYIRLRLGFLWGCFLHAFHNFIFFIPILITALVPLAHKSSIKIAGQNDFSGYMRISNDTIDFKGVKFNTIVSKLLNIKKEYIEFNDSIVANQYLTLHYAREAKGHTGKLNSSGLIVLGDLLSMYKLKMEQIPLDKYIYQIQIVDSVKLNLQIQGRNDPDTTWSTPIFYDDEIILHNANLSLIARTIKLNFGYEVVNSLTLQNRYTLKIPKLEFEGLNQFMTEQYGIKLNKSDKKVMGYKISKAPN